MFVAKCDASSGTRKTKKRFLKRLHHIERYEAEKRHVRLSRVAAVNQRSVRYGDDFRSNYLVNMSPEDPVPKGCFRTTVFEDPVKAAKQVQDKLEAGPPQERERQERLALSIDDAQYFNTA